jgi:glutathione S-transferase
MAQGDTMITLYTFGPAFGLPDPSPFVTKAEMLLKMGGLPYRTDTTGFSKAPKGKLPYIDDDRERIADSNFIRFHIEKKYGFDFDRGLTAEQRAIAWAFEKMVEEQLYFELLDARWTDDANFAKGPKMFFERVPALLRPFITAMVRRKVRQALHGQGTGRLTPAEIVQLGTRSIDALAIHLGQNEFFMGAQPSGADATMFPFVANMLCPTFDIPLRTAAERHDNLCRYVGRITLRYYPELSKATA